jgi:8-oxoguanine deaminase
VNAPDRLVIEACAVATVDAADTEHAAGHVVVEGGELRTGSEEEIARDARAASRRLLGLREVAG